MIDQLITTNTTPVQASRFTDYCPGVAELLGEGINRIYNNASVTGLFIGFLVKGRGWVKLDIFFFVWEQDSLCSSVLVLL